jgi:Haem-binding uptake, Tiki superfamily, ChaN
VNQRIFFAAATIGIVCVALSSSPAQGDVTPSETARMRLQPIVKGILAAWDKADLVCLGEDHGSKNDSDLRIALIEHPDFLRKVKVIMIESANVAHQDVLDRFVIDGEEMSREKLRTVWSDASGHEVWDAPIYEAFIRSVRKINLRMPRDRRVRLLAGDDPTEHNRGRWIREAVAREILDKNLKGLAVYGAGHCVNYGGGFPGEIGDKYPGRIWAVFNFFDVEAGRRAFGLGDEPALIQITGTDKAKQPSGRMFFLGRVNDNFKLGEVTDAIVYFGNMKDAKVPAVK